MTPSPIKVLVVEDEPLVLMDTADQLNDRGFVVIEASNADEAIIQLSNHPDIAVVFTDIDMPGSMDGLKLAAAVRDRWPPIKIVITSGHRRVSKDDLPIGSRFFVKPFRADAVASAMREMVQV
jgi:CheY-like chemotaxis protein